MLFKFPDPPLYKLYLNKKRFLLRQLADPEKIRLLTKLAKKIYALVLESQMSDELDHRAFMKSILRQLSEDDFAFFLKHKHDNFYKHKDVLRSVAEHEHQKALLKSGYLKKCQFSHNKLSTLNQLFVYITQAKIHLHKDLLIKELTSLKTAEELRHTLFEQEGFNKIVDFNERECLIMLKSYPNLKNKDLIEMTKIPRSNWYKYKKRFDELGLLSASSS